MNSVFIRIKNVIKHRRYLFIALIFLYTHSFAERSILIEKGRQPDTFYFSDDIHKVSIDRYLSYTSIDRNETPFLPVEINWSKSYRTPYNAGFTGRDHLFKLILKSKSPENSQVFIELANPSLNHVEVYVKDSTNRYSQFYLSGDRYPFNNRKILSPAFFIPVHLRANSVHEYILKIANDYRQLHVPMVVWDAEYYQEYTRNRSYLWGSLLGFILLFLLVNTIVTLFARSWLLMYYLFYTISFSLYILAMKGLGFQLLWPENTIFQSYAMELFKYATGFFFIPFIIKFFKTESSYPRLHGVLQIMLLAFIAVTAFRLLFVYTSFISPAFIMFITQLTSIGLIAGDILIWYIAYHEFKTNKRWEALWVFIVCTMFLINLVLMVALHLGFIPGWNWVENFLIFGFLMEVIILSTVLVYRYYILYKSNYQLAIDLGKAQKAAIHNFLDGQNEERKRLSEQLHDSISLSLANIKMRLSHAKSLITQQEVKEIINPLIEDLGNTSKDVRNISHSLSPLVLKRGTLESALEDLAQRTQWAHPDIKIHWNPVSNSDPAVPDHVSQNIYYIASELINNATKHAQAQEIYIDYIKENHSIELNVKDDGIGYSFENAINGLGLEHISQRVKLFNGLFSINRLEKGMEHRVQLAY